MEKYNTNIKKNVMWNTVGSVYYSLCQWVMTVVIVYLTSDYNTIGILGLAMTVTNSFTSISSFGMRSFQISDINGQFKHEQYIMSRRITAAVAFVACFIYMLIIRSSVYEIICILLYMMLRLIESTEDVYQGILQLSMRYDIIGKSYLMRGTAQIGLFVVVFLLTGRIELSFLVMVVSNLLIFLFYDKRLTRKIASLGKICWNKQILSLYKYCALLVVYYFSASSLATIVRVSIKQIMGTEALGIYSTIASPTVIVQLLGSVIFSPFIPIFADLFSKNNLRELKKYLIKILVIIATIFVIVTVAGLLLGKWGLTLLYNADVASHVELLVPLLWCTFLMAALWAFAGTLIAIRKIPYLVIGSIIGFGINLVLNKPLINQFGMNGGSFSQIISELFLFVFFMIMVFYEIYKKEKANKK